MQRAGRRLAGKLSEFVDHMHLVVVAKPLRNLSPRTTGTAGHPIERRFEPCDAREQLRTHANFLQEYSSKLAHTQAGTIGHGRDASSPGFRQHLMGRRRDSVPGTLRGRAE